jgi:hypothetical protein
MDIGGNLELLRSNGVKPSLLVGCTTEDRVASSAREAMFCDRYVVIVDNGVGRDEHGASTYLMGRRFDMAAAHEISAVWERRNANNGEVNA